VGEQARAMADLAEIYRNVAEALRATGDLVGALDAAGRSVEQALLPGAQVYLARNVTALAAIITAMRGAGIAAARAVAAGQGALRALMTADVGDVATLTSSRSRLETALS